MRFCVLSSGSSGNATYVEVSRDSGGILVDCGLNLRRLRPLLASVGRSADDVRAVLLTHGHSDHTCGLRTLRSVRSVPVYCAPGVGESFGAEVVPADEDFEVHGISARFFEVPHDAPTCGVRLSAGAAGMAVATDFGEADGRILAALRGVDALVLEANHDAQWLRRGPYPERLKRRISSRDGHLSNDQTAEIALHLAPHGLSEVVLAHLSETNNSPPRAVGTVSRVLRDGGFANIRVRAALRKHATPWIEVGTPPDAAPIRFVYGKESRSEGLFEVAEEEPEGYGDASGEGYRA